MKGDFFLSNYILEEKIKTLSTQYIEQQATASLLLLLMSALDREYQKYLYVIVILLEMKRVLQQQWGETLEIRSRPKESVKMRRRNLLQALRPYLTKEEKQKMVAIVSDISSKTSVKATLTEGGKLTIFEENGTTPFTVITDKDSGIQNTDSNNAILAIAGVVSVLGIAVVVKKVAKANA